MDFADANRNIMHTSPGNKGENPLTNSSNLPENLKTLHLILLTLHFSLMSFQNPIPL